MKLKSIVGRKIMLLGIAIAGVLAVSICNDQVFIAKENIEVVSVASEDEFIIWQTSIDVALEKAKKDKKLILVDVFTDGCGWCQTLEIRVFRNAEVADFINKNFICLKSNAEVGEGIKVVRHFEVYSFPTTLVLDANGKKLGKIVGFLKPEKYTKKLSKIIKKAK